MPSANVNWPPPLQRLTPFYPGQMGVPGTDSDRGLRLDSNGIILWVDPNHVDANDGRDGTNPDSPLRTVQAAVNKCRAHRGDVVAVMANSYWTHSSLTSARRTPIREAVTVNTPGVRIVGIAPSSSLGVFWEPPANDGVCITVNALDVTIEGFAFWNDTYTGGTGILAVWGGGLYGDNLTVRNCFFYSDLDYGVDLDFSYNTYIEDCYFQTIGIAAINNIGTHGDPDWIVIRRNIFTSCVAAIDLDDTNYANIEDNEILYCPTGIVITGGCYDKIKGNVINITQGAGTVAISGGGLFESVVHENVINGAPGGTNNMINLTGGSGNMVSGNWLSCDKTEYNTTCSDATSGKWVNNHCDDGEAVLPPT